MTHKKYLEFAGLLLIIAFDLILSFLFIFHFFDEGFISKDYDKLGTTISGLTLPIISIAAAILTFLAFKIQVDANKQVQEQFKIQQFESQFFKFLEVYNNLVDRIKYKSRFSNEHFEGKNYFYLLHLEYKKLLKDIDYFNKKLSSYSGDYITDKYFEELKIFNQNQKKIKKKEEFYYWVKLELAYVIIYYGAGITGRKNIVELLKDKYDTKYLKTLLNYLSNIPKDRKCTNYLEWFSQVTEIDFKEPNNNKFTKFYNGHQNRLGHYYRQLFGAIGYANKQGYITYLDKWDYVRHFRSLFSNYEQLMFFINSISLLGRSWELNVQDVDKNDKNNLLNKGLITKYDLIKNIPEYYISKYQVKDFYPNVDFNGYTVERERLEEEVYR